MWLRGIVAVILFLPLAGCLDLTIPPRPAPDAKPTFATCQSSTISAYKKANPNAQTLTDLANVSCQMDRKLDNASYLASTAATVCAHSMNAYAQSLPAKVGAAMTSVSGQATCAQNQSQCGYAFFINQSTTSATLELLGAAGCSQGPDATRGVLFACCTAPPNPVTPINPSITPRPPISTIPN